MSQTYLISYDLKQPADYSHLMKAIRELGAGYCHCLESTWVIRSQYSAAQIRDVLSRRLAPGDELVVLELGNNWATQGLSAAKTNWLHGHMPNLLRTA
jgi:hypothetical protein